MSMTAREAAKYCGINVNTLRRYTHEGRIRGIVWGASARNWKWRQNDLDKWLASRPPNRKEPESAA